MKNFNNSFRNSALLFTAFALFASCNSNSASKNDNSADTVADSISITESIDSASSIPSKAIELKSNWDSIKLHKISKESDTITFNSDSFKGINAEIISGKTGNIRINQIIMPDQQSDGPFGKDLDYSLDEKGDYKLIVGESLMQGDPFEGDYILKFKGK